ncbi:Winged helix-turn-helix transcription repressor, HrcA DNA-binding domain [Desulfitobacterium hafniense]|uniref:Winged helix-turn-helix transcription repressor, HrcA DNA-binding domain n=1 Tax=Desulfitobacterium hafniense TaxID=49338 RepID=A0A098AY40_DESHA|nr:hypothetical protein [Desulfitobacterium hafniense]CDX01534.1 Winged helix-turn-helix transcription repressor, HrcA DNA-binding domain [Desulfitobacterium hafniense]
MKTNFSYFEPEEDDVEVLEVLEVLEVKESQSLSATDAYIDFLFPSLPADEKIALSRKINDKYFHTEFFDKDYLKRRLNNQGLRDCDTFVSLSTVKGEAKTKEAENMCRRSCLGLDYDKKDFKEKFSTIREFTKHFYDTTGLYIHFAVDSGHGYHFYVGIEETTDIARVTSITRRFAVLSGADRSNISDAQTLRLPGTLNHKDKEALMAVNIVSRYKEEGFRRYTLDYLESKLKRLEKAAGIGRPVNRKKSLTRKFRGMYPCVAAMLDKGVPKGERNRCLGRIVNYFRDCARVSQKEALDTILQWNEKCNALCIDTEQKSDDEVTKDVERYWTPNNGKEYSLLGCISDNNSFSPILAKYCDEAQCPKYRRGPTKDSNQFFTLDSRYVTDKCLCNLKGYAYVIIKVLLDNKNAYKVSELVELTGYSEQTVTRTLNSLLELQLINKSTEGVVNTYKAKNYAQPKEKEYITLPVKLFDMLVNKEISEQELLLYIAIRRNAYASKKCTQDVLGKLLDLTERSISRTAKQMVGLGLLEIEPRKTGNIIKKGCKTIEKSFNFYRFPLEEQSDEDADI